MPQGCGHTTLSTIVEGNGAKVIEWQLNLTGTLLFGDTPGDRTVNFIGEPVFAGNLFELKNHLKIFPEIGLVIL